MADLPQPFFEFQLKDIVTALIALLGFTIAVTNLYQAYLRRPRVSCFLNSPVYIASFKNQKTTYVFVNCTFLNTGAAAAVVGNFEVQLKPDETATVKGSPVTFYPVSVMERTEVRESGALHSKGVAAHFVGNFAHFVVPKGDTAQKEWRCNPMADAALEPGEYFVTVAGRFLGRGRSEHKFQCVPARLRITAEDLDDARKNIGGERSNIRIEFPLAGFAKKNFA